MCEYIHLSAGAIEVQKRALAPLELEFYMVVSC